MSADKYEEDYHLTPDGWIIGSARLYSNETKTVPRPHNAALTMIREQITACGIDPADVSWVEVWRSQKISAKRIESLLIKHGNPLRTPKLLHLVQTRI
jgi:hypothetical protein